MTDGDIDTFTNTVYHGPNKGAIQELWAFMPTDFLSRLDYLTVPANAHRFMVDGTPVIYHLDLPPTTGGSGNGVVDVSTERAIAIFGLRKGGRSYYALDIHNPFSPSMKWSVVPDESAVFPSTRTVAGGPNQATVKAILGTMGFSSTTPALARIKYQGGLRDAVFLGGGFSLPEIEANYAGVKLGRSVMALDVYTGEVIAAKDLTAVSASIGPIAAGVVPFEFFLNSGMAQRAYFTDFYGGLWAWGSKKVSSGGATDPYDGYRIDTSDLAEWTTDGNVGSQAGIRKVAQDGTAASALYTTLPAPFRVGSFPGAPKVAGSPTPAAVGIAIVSGDRNNPLSNGAFTTYVGNNPPPPSQERVTVVFDRQDSRLWGLDSAGGPDTGIVDAQLKNFSAQNNPTAPEIQPGNANFYLAPSSGNPFFGYYLNLPGVAGGFVPKGITEPMVVAGSLFYSYFFPGAADPCIGGTGSTYTRKVCDVIYPIFDDARLTVACKSGQSGSPFVGVASSFATYSTRGVLQAGATAVANPQPGESATTPVINTTLGRQQERFPKVRVWRTVR
jgi:Tfp pilus tip-associated adhesin PilY1